MYWLICKLGLFGNFPNSGRPPQPKKSHRKGPRPDRHLISSLSGSRRGPAPRWCWGGRGFVPAERPRLWTVRSRVCEKPPPLGNRKGFWNLPLAHARGSRTIGFHLPEPRPLGSGWLTHQPTVCTPPAALSLVDRESALDSTGVRRDWVCFVFLGGEGCELLNPSLTRVLFLGRLTLAHTHGAVFWDMVAGPLLLDGTATRGQRCGPKARATEQQVVRTACFAPGSS